MNKTHLLLSLLVLSLTLSGCSRIRTGLLPSSSTNSQSSESASLESLLDTTDTQGSGSSTDGDQSVLAQGEVEKGGVPSARKVDFTSQAAALEYAKIGPTLYFFTSQSCASCATATKDFTNNISDLPAGMTIVTVNFDTAQALRSKYNITSAHTFILIDETGNALSTWQGGGVNEILARF